MAEVVKPNRQTGAVWVQAHGKVNLALAVLGRRPDGYHEVQMVMTPLALHDTIRVEVTGTEGAEGAGKATGIAVVTDDSDIPSGPENLAYRAALALKQAGGVNAGAAIAINKRIPAAAGLGGGSADAAAVLLALNRLWGLNWSRERLQPLAASLGADVPFCLLGQTALAEGIGERLTPLPPAPPIPAVVATPQVQWSGPKTATVYRAYRTRPGDGRKARVDPVVAALRRGDGAALAAALANDLEPGAVELHPLIAELKQAVLAAGAAGAVMAGAGPSVLALCPRPEAVEAVAAAARRFTPVVAVTALQGRADPFALAASPEA